MLVYAIALWGIGLGGGTWLAYSASLPWLPPAQSYWSASILANTVAVLGLWWVGAQKVRAVIRQLSN